MMHEHKNVALVSIPQSALILKLQEKCGGGPVPLVPAPMWYIYIPNSYIVIHVIVAFQIVYQESSIVSIAAT